ncbi:MAG: peptide deformylase [Anaerolineae bacterium]|nr:peptide deformylase [Anaerolineae bacterium]MCX8067807.1 peptide deformylase [Anaerolineae bacterium]MDW7992573.1 peptide deformylase [Anaerolineae bacterium]
MAIRPILYSENPLLRRKSRKVQRVTEEVEELIQDMFETMRAANGVGLAAVQIGVPLRVIVVGIPEDVEDPAAGTTLSLINPEIVRASPEVEEGVEGCLSVPGWAGNVPRHVEITVRGLDRKGKPVRMKARGYLARVLQHEIDHTEGILFLDRATEVWPVEEGEEEKVEAAAVGMGPRRGA